MRVILRFVLLAAVSGVGAQEIEAAGFHVVSFTGKAPELLSKGEEFGSAAFQDAGFPLAFSRQLAGVESVTGVPPGIPERAWPQRVSFADVFTFFPDEAEPGGAWPRRRNDNTRVRYQLQLIDSGPEAHSLQLRVLGRPYRKADVRLQVRRDASTLAYFDQAGDEVLLFVITELEAHPLLPRSRRPGGPVGDAEKLELVTKVNPVYPEEALRARADGTVLASVSVDPKGEVDRSRMVLLECPALALCAEAFRVLPQWWYRWSQPRDRPARATVSVNFVLRGK